LEQTKDPSAEERFHTNRAAIAAMVCGILGIVTTLVIAFLGVILGILAVVLAGAGRRRAGSTGEGRPQAITGLITGWMAIIGGTASIIARFMELS
jgi:hypothetical protein